VKLDPFEPRMTPECAAALAAINRDFARCDEAIKRAFLGSALMNARKISRGSSTPIERAAVIVRRPTPGILELSRG